MNLCNYGCGQEAKYQFRNSKRCCNKNWQSCLGTKNGNGRILVETNELCNYGCGQVSRYRFKEGKLCCSKTYKSCPEVIKKQAEKKKGKTKENDEGARSRAKKLTGRTKENDGGRRKQAEAQSKIMIKKWKNLEYQQKQYEVMNLKPNKCETLILNILKKLYPGEWKYTGDYSFWINGKNPDFTCVNGKKLLIEHFGSYWHKGEDPEEHKKIFSEFGYSTLVIWENELKNLEHVEK